MRDIEAQASKLVNTSIDDAKSSLALWKRGESKHDVAILTRAAAIEAESEAPRRAFLDLIRRTIKRLGGAPEVTEIAEAAVVREGVELAPQDEHAARFVSFHMAGEQHASAAVYCAAAAGAVAIQKKASCKHGEFVPWADQLKLADGSSITKRTVQRYMQLAQEMAARINALPPANRAAIFGEAQAGEDEKRHGVSLLPAKLPPHDSAQSVITMLASFDSTKTHELTQMTMARAISEITQDASLRQLYFDWGIVEPPKRKGGDNALQAWLTANRPDLAGTRVADLPADVAAEWEAYRKAHAPTPEEKAEGERQFADKFWRQMIGLLQGEGAPPWGLLETREMIQLMVALDKVVGGMKRVLKERGER